MHERSSTVKRRARVEEVAVITAKRSLVLSADRLESDIVYAGAQRATVVDLREADADPLSGPLREVNVTVRGATLFGSPGAVLKIVAKTYRAAVASAGAETSMSSTRNCWLAWHPLEACAATSLSSKGQRDVGSSLRSTLHRLFAVAEPDDRARLLRVASSKGEGFGRALIEAACRSHFVDPEPVLDDLISDGTVHRYARRLIRDAKPQSRTHDRER
jgi:hypothetical protein